MIAIDIMEQNQPGWFALAIIRNLCGMFNVEMMSFQENEIRTMSVSKRPYYVHFVPEKEARTIEYEEQSFRHTIACIGALSVTNVSTKANYHTSFKTRKGQKTPDWKRIKIFGEANVGETARMLDEYSRDGGPIFRCQATHVEGIANINVHMQPVCEEILRKEAEIYPKYDDSQRLEETSHYKTFMAGTTQKPITGKNRVKRSSAPETLPSESQGVHIRWSKWEFAVAFERARDIEAKRRFERDKARANRMRIEEAQNRERMERNNAILRELFED